AGPARAVRRGRGDGLRRLGAEREADGAIPHGGIEEGHREIPAAGVIGGEGPSPGTPTRAYIPTATDGPRRGGLVLGVGRGNRPMAPKKPVIAVVGATGAQGSGLVRAILQDPERRFTVRAITRKPDSEKGRALAAQGAEVVAADTDDAGSLDRAFAGAT